MAIWLLLLSASTASAAPSITGKLNEGGYTVIALAANGQAGTVIAHDGSFSVPPPADVVTLHLRAADGTYAGPIVLQEKAEGVAQASAAVTSAKRKVTQLKRKVRAAQRKVRKARSKRAKRRATTRLRKAGRQLRSARTRLKNAEKLLAEAQKRAADRPNWAILGVKAGASLGDIRVDRARGYASTGVLEDRVWQTTADAGRIAHATNGVPIGAGTFGRVVSPPPATPVPGDTDVDGVPNALDIDDDGDLILDDFDRSTGARAAQVLQQFRISSQLVLPIQYSVNVNAGSSNEDIEAGLANTAGHHSGGRLTVDPLPGDAAPELDCGGTVNPTPPPPRVGGLVYCSTGGTGQVFQPGVESSEWPRFPGDYDQDGDGFGTLGLFTMSHGARSDQIRTGDVLIQRVVRDGVENVFTATVQYIFVTAPALMSWRDTAGNSRTVTYPTGTDPFTIAPGSDGDIVLTLTLWRPQRKRIPADPAPSAGESGEWTDIGGLKYSVGISHVQDAPEYPGGHNCPQAALSTSDPNLTPVPPGTPNGGFVDLATDRPANPANTLTYTLNATRCAAAGGFSWNPDKVVGFNLNAETDANANAHQGGVSFRRSP